MRVILATYEEMKEHWPFVRQGLVVVRRDLDKQSFWEPEHVQLALEQSFQQQPVCQLWLAFEAEDDRQPTGFFVTQMMVDPFLHVPLSLFVWIAYKDPEYMKDGVAACSHALEAYARARGLRYLEMMTAIEPFARHLERHGWQRTLQVMRKPLWVEQREELH